MIYLAMVAAGCALGALAVWCWLARVDVPPLAEDVEERLREADARDEERRAVEQPTVDDARALIEEALRR